MVYNTVKEARIYRILEVIKTNMLKKAYNKTQLEDLNDLMTESLLILKKEVKND